MILAPLQKTDSVYDLIVVGGGLVGMTLALGLATRGLKVLVLDGGDTDYRAARATSG